MGTNNMGTNNMGTINGVSIQTIDSENLRFRQVAEKYVESFYIRPGGSDREWETYRSEEEPRIRAIEKLLQRWFNEELEIRALTRYYSNRADGTSEVTIILGFGPLDHNQEVRLRSYFEPGIHEMVIDSLGDSECQLHFEIMGVQAIKLIINETY